MAPRAALRLPSPTGLPARQAADLPSVEDKPPYCQSPAKPPAQPHNGSGAFSGVDDGVLALGDKHTEAPAGTCRVDPFQAQWAALGSESGQHTRPSLPDPLSGDLRRRLKLNFKQSLRLMYFVCT